MYDITQPQSFASLPRWLEDLETVTDAQTERLTGIPISPPPTHTHTHRMSSELDLPSNICFFAPQNTSNQKHPVVMLLGNKIDRSSERRVSRLKAEEVMCY